MRKESYLFIGVIFLVGIAGFNLDAQTGPSLDFVGKDAPVAKPGSKVNKYRDLELTIKIRRLLSEDPDLGQLNIGVSVRDGVLRLWGPVPSVEKTQKALAKVGTVKLLFDVNVAAGRIVVWVAGVFVPRLSARHAFPRTLHIVARFFDLFVFVAGRADRHALRAVITTVLCTRASGIHRESQRPQKAEAGTAGNEE